MSPKAAILDPRYIQAARKYIFDGKSVAEIAEEMGVARETVSRWRQKVAWQEAVNRVLAEGASDARAIAYRRLLASAEGEPGGPGIAACNTLLDRIEGPKPQRLEHSGPGGGPLEVAVGTVSMDELMADDEGRALLSRIATRLCPRNGDAAHAGDEAD